MDELKEEIIFLDSEILDDDDDAPLGTLVNVVKDEPAPHEEQSEPQEEAAEAPQEEPAAEEEQPQEEAIEEPEQEEQQAEVAADEAPAQIEEQEVLDEPQEEQPQDEIVEEPAPQEEVAEEPQEESPALEEPAEEVAEEQPQDAEEAPQEEAVEEPEQEEQQAEVAADEEPKATPAPAKERKPRAKKPAEEKAEPEQKPAPKRSATSINLKGGDVNSVLSSSNFEVKDEKPAKVVKSKKVKEDDVWQVAPVVAPKKEEEPKKEAPKKAPAKKAQPKAEEPKKEEPNKAPAKSAKTTNTKSTEDKKMATKEAAKPAAKTAAKPAPKAAAKPAPKKDDKPQEKVLIEGTGDPKTRAKFVIKVTDNGNYVYKLFASNKKVIAIGAQPYPALPSCKTGIQSVIKNSGTAPIEDQTLQKPVEQKCPKWVIFLDKKGEFRLRLIASNGNIVATTNDGYLSKDAAKKGIDAIARASQNADIVRNDDLW